jgi:hypothetical protein
MDRYSSCNNGHGIGVIGVGLEYDLSKQFDSPGAARLIYLIRNSRQSPLIL